MFELGFLRRHPWWVSSDSNHGPAPWKLGKRGKPVLLMTEDSVDGRSEQRPPSIPSVAAAERASTAGKWSPALLKRLPGFSPLPAIDPCLINFEPVSLPRLGRCHGLFWLFLLDTLIWAPEKNLLPLKFYEYEEVGDLT